MLQTTELAIASKDETMGFKKKYKNDHRIVKYKKNLNLKQN
jgi:hypothetical protein